jgi:uncharacterized protein YndB with AHSA1/START domain
MSAMSDFTIEREIVIDAPAAVVWRTITEPDQITQWFADRVRLELRPGGDGELVFDNNANPVTAPVTVESVDPPHRFSFRWGHPAGDRADATNSALVEFTLQAEAGDRTRLRVVETGLDAVDWSDEQKSRYVEEHRHGWVVQLGRLEQLYATRAG